MNLNDGKLTGTLPRFAGPSLYWNAPVVEALDMVEGLSGFAPDNVEWDFFRFWSDRLHAPMRGAFICAYPTDQRVGVKFRVTGDRLTISPTSPQTPARELSTHEVAHVLDVPVSSADRASTALRDALTLSVTRYNVAHDATRTAHRTRLAQQRPILERPVPSRPEALDL
jgi:hypothetical protein